MSTITQRIASASPSSAVNTATSPRWHRSENNPGNPFIARPTESSTLWRGLGPSHGSTPFSSKSLSSTPRSKSFTSG